jgi:hypothetical protein
VRFHFVGVFKAAADALASQDTQLHFCHVEPTAAARCVLKTQTPREAMHMFGWEGRLQAGQIVRVQIVAHQRDVFGGGIVFFEKTPDLFGPVDARATIATRHTAPTT